MNILLLSNSLTFESVFIQHLNVIKHEVFCSENLVQDLKKSKGSNGFINYFQGIIFSETLSNQTVYDILSHNDFDKIMVILKSTKTLSVQEKTVWGELGVTYFISEDTNLDHLREALCSNSDTGKITTNSEKEQFLKKRLSKKELSVFNELSQSSGYVSREDLSEIIWGKVTKSTQSNLSNIINKINRKLKETGMLSVSISSKWGKGYYLQKEKKINPLQS